MRDISHFLCTVLCAAVVGCGNTSGSKSSPQPAVNGVSSDLRMHPGEKDRCPVCAMTTHDKKLPAAIALDDGRTFYFCGPGCMIRTWLEPQTHLNAAKGALKHAVATDFLTGDHIDAEDAFWIVGSDVVGPMGPMPVPLKNQTSVEAFKKRHGGTQVFRLEEMTLEKWRALKAAAKNKK